MKSKSQLPSKTFTSNYGNMINYAHALVDNKSKEKISRNIFTPTMGQSWSKVGNKILDDVLSFLSIPVDTIN